MGESKVKTKIEEELKCLKKICEKLEESTKAELEKGIEAVDTKEMGEVVDMIKDLYEAKEKAVKACYYITIMEAMEEGQEGEEEGNRYYDRYRYASGRFAPKGRGSRRGYEEMPYMHEEPDMMDLWPYDRMRDMDLPGRMYYSSGGSQGSRDGGNRGTTGSGSGGRSQGQSGGSGSSGGNYSRGYEEGSRRGYEDGYRDGSRSGSSRYENARKGYSESKEKNDGNTPEENSENMKMLEKLLKVIQADVKELAPHMSTQEKQMAKQKIEEMGRSI